MGGAGTAAGLAGGLPAPPLIVTVAVIAVVVFIVRHKRS